MHRLRSRPSPRLSRRIFLGGLAATGAALWAGQGGRLALADAATGRRLVVILLRGGLDGLSLVPPVGDPQLRGLRERLGEDAALPLTPDFGLHAALASVAARPDEVLALHAVGLPPGGDRSHFEAQDMLEGGGAAPRQLRTGWLARALASLPDGPPSAVAVGYGLPLLLRGAAQATAIDPGMRLRDERDDELLLRLEQLYADDPELAAAWAQGQQTRALLETVAEDDVPRRSGRSAEAQRASARALGQILAAEAGPRVAVVEVGGWDTHATQRSTLQTRLGGLDAALDGLRAGLGPAWGQSAILLVTEFGRTVAPNGTGGTDHGSAGAALLVGGAVRGGVRADWPGLGATARLDGRDLRPTTDVRAILKGVLRDHLGVSEAALAREVFPDSPDLAPLSGLLRA